MLTPPSLHKVLRIVIVVLAYGADGRPLTDESSANNQVILSYTTDTHSRHETGIPGRAVQGFYRLVSSHDCGIVVIIQLKKLHVNKREVA